MDMTDKQRRWWFANHPDYGRSRAGTRKQGQSGTNEKSKKVDPKQVDEYVDNALSYVEGPVVELLKSTKRNFGTQAKSVEQETQDSSPSNADSKSYAQYRDPLDRKEAGFVEHRPKKMPTWREEVVVPDPITALDFGGVKQLVTSPVKAIKSLLIRKARGGVINAVKKTTRRPPRLPPKGTPEYKKIKAAAKKGIRRKKKLERQDIMNGGKGSGVWTEKELKDIRNGKDFPPDAQWHHDPTVANRPDLAADPKSVHIMRGGRKAHFEKGHNRNWQEPYE